MATTQVSTSVLKDGSVTSAKLDTNIAIDGNLTVDTNTLYVDSSNNRVGIGTTSPDSTLTINGTGWTKAGHKISSYYATNAGDGQILNLGVTGNIGYLQSLNGTTPNALSLDGSSVTFRTGAYSTAMRIDSSGRVGIGTSSPSAALDIMDIPSGGNGTILNIGLDASNPTRAKIHTETYNGVFSLYDSGNVEDVRITSKNGSDSYINNGGNVGIGTNSPSANLHLKSTGDVTLLLEADSDNINENDNPVIQFSQDNGGITANIGLEGIGGNVFPTAGGNGFYIDSTEEIMLGTAGTERMRITSGGNVGIGTATPDAKLHLKGGSLRIDNSVGFTANIILTEGSGDENILLEYDGTGAGSGNYFSIYSNVSSWVGKGLGFNYIPSNGRVGIGTSSPASVLHIKNSTPEILLEDSDLALRKIKILGNNGNLGLFADPDSAQSNSIIYFNVDGSERMRINSSGNVGIGTTSPTNNSKLTVLHDTTGATGTTGGLVSIMDAKDMALGNGGGIRFGGIYQTGGTPNADMGYIKAYKENATSGNFSYALTFGTRASGGNPTERMRLQSNGDLHVDGDVVAYSTTISDQRLKDDIKTIDNALETIEKLRGVSYVWNNGKRKNQKDIGLIAQEVEKVIPEIVHDKKMPLIDDEVYKTIDYEKLIGVLIESVKELSAEVKELRSQINI